MAPLGNGVKSMTSSEANSISDCIKIGKLQLALTELIEVIDTFEGEYPLGVEVQMPYTTAKLLAAKVLAAKAVLVGEAK